MNSGMPIETVRHSTAASTPPPTMPRPTGFAGVLATVTGGEPQAAGPADISALSEGLEVVASAAGGAADAPAAAAPRAPAGARAPAVEPAVPTASPSTRPRLVAVLPSAAAASTRKADPVELAALDATIGSLVPQHLLPSEPIPFEPAISPQPGGMSKDAEQVVETTPATFAAVASPSPVDRCEDQPEQPDTAAVLASADDGSTVLPPPMVSAAPLHEPGHRGARAQNRGEAGDPGTALAGVDAPAPPARMFAVVNLADPDGTTARLPPERSAAATDRSRPARPEPVRQARDRINPLAAGDAILTASASGGSPLRQAEQALQTAADIQIRPGTLAPITEATAPVAHAPQPVAHAAAASSSPAMRLEDTSSASAAGGGVAGERSPTAQAAGAIRFLARGKDGAETLILRLDPEELGRVQISITQSPKGPASIAIRVEQPETLLLLMRDQGQLHRALDSAGIAPEGRQLSFQLAQVPAVSVLRDAAAAVPTDAARSMQQDAFNAGSGQLGSGQPGQNHDGWQSGGRRDPGGTAASGRDPSPEWNFAVIAGSAPGQRGGGPRGGIDITA